jgi:periplasmic divalent cation tolerance protein
MDDSEHLVVLISFGSGDQAEAAARVLVTERLAACVHVVSGITAVYRWEGRMEVEPQTVLVAKTTRHAYPRLQERARALHCDVVPEIIALPVVDGLPAYLAWIDDEVEGGE